MLPYILRGTRQPLHQRTTQPKMPVVPRLRNAPLQPHFKGACVSAGVERIQNQNQQYQDTRIHSDHHCTVLLSVLGELSKGHSLSV